MPDTKTATNQKLIKRINIGVLQNKHEKKLYADLRKPLPHSPMLLFSQKENNFLTNVIFVESII